MGREGGGGENVYTYDYTCLHVCRRRESPGKVTAAVFSAVCSLGSNVAFLMTGDFSVSAKTMQMKVVQKVLDRMLMGCGIHLSPHIGGKPLIGA